MATFRRELTHYFPRESLKAVTKDINESPGTILLKEVVSICDSITHCTRRFTRKKNGDFTKDSNDSFQSLMMSSFALIMSHFETFQRDQFAHLVNSLDFLTNGDDTKLAKDLEKMGCELSVLRLLAGRGQPREPGHIISDALTGWHDPQKVNRIYKLIFSDYNLFSSEFCTEISLMWQIRHSIVHTGGVVTREDCMKHPLLKGYWDKRLAFSDGFIPAVSRRLHIIVQKSLDGLRQKVTDSFDESTGVDEVPEFIDYICGYVSPRRSWFKTADA